MNEEKSVVSKALASAVGIIFLVALTGANDIEGTSLGTSTIVPVDYRCSNLAGDSAVVITYESNYNLNLTVVVYGVVRNSIGQIVYYTTSTIFVPANGTATAYLVIATLPYGDYFINAFAIVPSGVEISPEVSLSCSVKSTTAPLGPQAFTLVAPLEFCGGICGSPLIKAIYKNNLNHTVTGVVYCVVHNGNGQTVYYTTAIISPTAGKNVTAYLVLAGFRAGSYYASVFVATPLTGIVISPTSLIEFGLYQY